MTVYTTVLNGTVRGVTVSFIGLTAQLIKLLEEEKVEFDDTGCKSYTSCVEAFFRWLENYSERDSEAFHAIQNSFRATSGHFLVQKWEGGAEYEYHRDADRPYKEIS